VAYWAAIDAAVFVSLRSVDEALDNRARTAFARVFGDQLGLDHEHRERAAALFEIHIADGFCRLAFEGHGPTGTWDGSEDSLLMNAKNWGGTAADNYKETRGRDGASHWG